MTELEEHFIWQCERCGRMNRYAFYEHSTSKLYNDFCQGKVKRIKFKNAW